MKYLKDIPQVRNACLAIFFTFFLLSCHTPVEKAIHLVDIRGNDYQLNANNKKWLLINVWATWCAPCVAEVPELNHFYLRHRDKVFLFGANYDHLIGDKLRQAVNRLQIKFPVLVKPYESLFNLKTSESVPVTYLLTPQGHLKKTLYGPQTEASLLALLRQHGAL